jgi:RNA polymerase sigma factor (sigma-70 family)
MKSPRRFEPISRAAENRLVRKAQQGDEDAGVQLWERYRLFLIKQIHRYCGKFALSDLGPDLESVALVGFQEAVRDYSPRRKARFVTLVWLRVRRRLLEELKQHMGGRDLDEATSVPLKVLDDVHCGTDLYDGKFGGAPTTHPDHFGMHPNAGAVAPPVPDAVLMDKDLMLTAMRNMDALSDEDRDVLIARFWDGLTMEDLRTRTGHSRMRIRELLQAILVHIRPEEQS